MELIKKIFYNKHQRENIIYLDKKEWEIYYSCANKWPYLVIQSLNSKSGQPGPGEEPVIRSELDESKLFKPDSKIPPSCSLKQKDYENYMMYGGSQGHNAPFGHHKTTLDIAKSTYLYSNMTPQEIVFNAGAWMIVENWTKYAAGNKKVKNFRVINGSIANKKTTNFNGSKINVPTHMYKIVICESTNEQFDKNKLYIACFLYPNIPIEPTEENVKIENYLIGLKELSQMTKLNFFPLFKHYYNFNPKTTRIVHLNKLIYVNFRLMPYHKNFLLNAFLFGKVIYAKSLEELEENWKLVKKTCLEINNDPKFQEEYYLLAKSRLTKALKKHKENHSLITNKNTKSQKMSKKQQKLVSSSKKNKSNKSRKNKKIDIRRDYKLINENNFINIGKNMINHTTLI